MVSALLEHLERSRGEPRRPGRGLRLRGDRGHARHHHARLACPRPGGRLPAVPARKGHRPVRERSGVPAPDRGSTGRPAPPPPPPPTPRPPGPPPTPAPPPPPHSRGSGPPHPARAPLPRPFRAGARAGQGPRSGGALRADLLAAVAALGGLAVPPRPPASADRAQGNPAPGRRPPCRRRGH